MSRVTALNFGYEEGVPRFNIVFGSIVFGRIVFGRADITAAEAI